MTTETRYPFDRAELFRLAVLCLLLGQMFVYYDTATKTIPHINLYLLGNLLLIVFALLPGRRAAGLLWALVWPAGALLRWDWAVRPTNSDVFWATSQGVDFLLHGLNPYTQPPTWVYQHQPGISNYPNYSYFPGALFAEIPFYLLGNVRLGLAVADLGTAVLIYLLARPRIGVWPARAVAGGWLLFLPAFQVPMLLAVVDFLLLFWITLAVWLYSRGHPVWSALAAAIACATKQYGFLFAVPWGILLLQPMLATLRGRWQAGERGRRLLDGISSRVWLSPITEASAVVLIILPLALLSPKAFVDATIGHHASYLPDPMMGTPQWNQSITAQMVGLGWMEIHAAARLAAVLMPLLLLAVLLAALIKTRDAASALRWSALAVAVLFAFSNVRVQFFYWRLPLLLAILAYIYYARQRPDNEPAAAPD
jgi:hypothetical protein